MLIEAGADLNIQDENGYTALMVAVINRKIEIVKLLIDKGADIDIKNKYGNTALMISANLKFIVKDKDEIFKILRDHWEIEKKQKARIEV